MARWNKLDETTVHLQAAYGWNEMKLRDMSEALLSAADFGAASEGVYAPILRPDDVERRNSRCDSAERLEAQASQAAVTEERNRIAREIHDTLAQGLAAIRLQLELARGNDELPPDASQAIELAQQIANENFVDARRLISALRSPPPCLTTALCAAVERARRLGPARVVASLEPVPAPPSEVTHELLRIAQEAIQNAEHHAAARTITVSLKTLPGRGLRMSVADDGRGFDLTSASGGFGLAGMRERAAMVGAELTIESEPGAGARVSVSWSPA
jgi:two-component system, NarL family, sensor kinase